MATSKFAKVRQKVNGMFQTDNLEDVCVHSAPQRLGSHHDTGCASHSEFYEGMSLPEKQ